MKIFMGLTEVAGYYTNLQKGFVALGLETVFADLGAHPFKYHDNATSPRLIKLIEFVARKRATTHLPLKAVWKSLELLLRPVLFVWAIAKYDVFIFGFNSSFLGFYDLPILKLFHKKIIYVFHGTDSRPPYLNGVFGGLDLSPEKLIALTRQQKQTVKTIERYADVIISNHLSSHFHERNFIIYQIIGNPFSMVDAPTAELSDETNHISKILHAPSRTEVKGTFIIRQAIDNLKAKGYLIEFIEIIGKTNAEVLHELNRCDFVVDQLYSDTPLAVLATEASALGKAVIVGGYALAEFSQLLPPELLPIAHFCHRDDLETAIEKLIIEPEYRLELGKKAKLFVANKWSSEQVAHRFLRLIDNNIPADWWYDPQNITDVHGCGLAETRAKELIKAVINLGGKAALQLSDKPELERLIIEFARTEKA